jgi:hypothetical protein
MQEATIPNQMMIEAGAATIPNPPPSTRRGSSALGIASICQNQGVNMNTMKKPLHTTAHDE